MEVPIDYAAPERGSLKVGINRILANAFAPYRGVVFVNPGGPGLAGKPFVEGSALALRELLPGFDFVGFDPRGTGDSQALRCENELDLADAYATGKAAAVLDGLKSEGERCARENQPLFDHLGSNDVVDDIDFIRRALGHAEINFLGLSYGTRLAALYARKYPAHARAVVLDAAVSPSGDFIEMVEGQFDALLEAHEAFFDACAAGELACPPEPERVFQSLVERYGPTGELHEFVAFWQSMLVTPPGRLFLARGLTEEASGGTPGEMMTGMSPAAELIPAINVATNLTVQCNDDTHAPLDADEAEAFVARFEALSPTFASLGIKGLSCNAWPNQKGGIPSGPFAPRIPPLVIGGTLDILTPYAWAEEMALELGGASLLKSHHYGHGATTWGSRCVFERLLDYLITPRALPDGIECPAP